MKFKINGNRVECYRPVTENEWTHVTSFDAHLEEVAPHVAGALTSFEVQELQQWMRERKRNASTSGLNSALFRIQALARKAQQTLDKGDVPRKDTVNKLKDTADSVRQAVLTDERSA